MKVLQDIPSLALENRFPTGIRTADDDKASLNDLDSERDYLTGAEAHERLGHKMRLYRMSTGLPYPTLLYLHLT